MRKIHELKVEETNFAALYNNQKHVMVLEKENYSVYDYVLITSLEEESTKDVLIELSELIEDINIRDGLVIFKTTQVQKGV